MSTHGTTLLQRLFVLGLTLVSTAALPAERSKPARGVWTLGTPIVTYWAGPAMTDATAQQMADGGWNLVWCTEPELDTARRHGLRAQLHDGLISPASLDDPAQRAKLDALIARVRTHPALYSYFLTDEPNATNFPGLGKLVAYLRERDPAHLAYINLFPTYANNGQLGNKGDKITAYNEHLAQFISIVKPALLSYDHYQFAVNGDNPDYFLNLALIRRAAQQAGVPFLNIVQACTWAASMRVPKPDEMRYLVYTTLAGGAQGISYYVYSCPGHTGMIAHADGTPTERYDVLKSLNREFVAIASQLKPLQCSEVYHQGMLPPGTEPLPTNALFRFDPPLPEMEFKLNRPVKGAMLGFFGPLPKKNKAVRPTHAVVVNLDYDAEATIGLTGARRFDIFDATTSRWSKAAGKRVELRLPPGGGKLVRLRGG
jgi:hypothetical protein